MPVSLICVKVVDLAKPNLRPRGRSYLLVCDLKNEVLLPAPDGDSYAAQCRYASAPKEEALLEQNLHLVQKEMLLLQNFFMVFPQVLESG